MDSHLREMTDDLTGEEYDSGVREWANRLKEVLEMNLDERDLN